MKLKLNIKYFFNAKLFCIEIGFLKKDRMKCLYNKMFKGAKKLHEKSKNFHRSLGDGTPTPSPPPPPNQGISQVPEQGL